MENLIHKFYAAFQQQDAETMVSCYHNDIVFNDPAFGTLNGDKAKNMWRMLCQNAKDFKMDFSNIKVENNVGYAHWEADYIFSQTGKKVHNIIDATFEFKDGQIIKHSDNFNLHNWAKQALGFKGTLLGGTTFFKKKLQQQTNNLLFQFESKQK